MELYERQQFDHLLHTAVERFVERIEQRNEGASKTLDRLRANREAEGIWLSQFVDAVFKDFLIDNLEGACFVLRALASRPTPTQPRDGTVEQDLIKSAKLVFADIFAIKAGDLLEQHAAFESVPAGGNG